MPKPGGERYDEAGDARLVEREFRPLFLSLRNERRDYAAVLDALAREPKGGGVADVLLRVAASGNSQD